MKDTVSGILLEEDEYKAYLEANLNIAQAKTDENKETQTNPSISLYELNRGLISQLKPYDMEDTKKAFEAVKDWLSKNRDSYYMFLCKEKSYFTVFDATQSSYIVVDMASQFFALLEEFDVIYSIEVDTNNAVAVWACFDDDELPHCYYLFPYGRGVIRL